MAHEEGFTTLSEKDKNRYKKKNGNKERLDIVRNCAEESE
jgi:hypothetical protein